MGWGDWWDRGGSKWSESMWRSGKKHGSETGWREDGSKLWQDTSRNGEIHGAETWWYESGTKEIVIYYNRNKIYARMVWDGEGNVLAASFQTT